MAALLVLIVMGPDDPAGLKQGKGQGQEGSGRACNKVKVPSVTARPISNEIRVVTPFAKTCAVLVTNGWASVSFNP
jgi:hypothetical protein